MHSNPRLMLSAVFARRHAGLTVKKLSITEPSTMSVKGFEDVGFQRTWSFTGSHSILTAQHTSNPIDINLMSLQI